MESFSSVKVSAHISQRELKLLKFSALCERLLNMSQTTLVMYIHFLTSSQDITEVDTTYHQLLDAICY